MQALEAPEFTVPGLQLNSVTTSGEEVVIVPPVAAMVMALPAGDTPIAFLTVMVVAVVAGASVTFTIAATPFCMTVVSNPVSKQV